MGADQPEPDEVSRFFAGHPIGASVFEAVRDVVEGFGPASIRVTKSQVAFRRRVGFAFVWMPGTWLRGSVSEAVLSIALRRHDRSPRFKEVAHPAAHVWMHHLEVAGPDDVADDQVTAWLLEAYDQAG